MRLTLRTLLAFRDNVLEPDVERMLHEKISENSFATDLLKRIDAVVHNRQLGVYATDRNDANLPVNISACYLENTLPADRVADVERACLVSDVALAEAAACHEILNQLLNGPPIAVSKVIQNRLLFATIPGEGPPKNTREANSPHSDLGATPKVSGPNPFGDAAKSQKRVFISHSSLDQQFVEREIVALLREHLLAFWYAPANIRTSAHWERTILLGLQSCDWFILVMSPRSAASEWVKDELNWAIRKMFGRIIPVIIEGCDPFDFHIRLDRIQAVDFQHDLERAKRELLAILRGSVDDDGHCGPEDDRGQQPC